MSSSSSTSYRRYNRNQDVTHKTHSNCDPPYLIPVQIAWTIDNPELPGEYYKQLVYNLHEENKALKKNKMPGVMEDSSKGYSNYTNSQSMVKDLKDGLTFVKSKLKLYDRILLVDINEGSSKGKLPPLGSPARPRRDVSPETVKLLKYGPPPALLHYFDEFPTITDESDYESNDNETKTKSITSKNNTVKNLLFYEDTIEKYVPVGKAASQKAIIKSPHPISGVVLGLAILKTWDDIVQITGKRKPGNHGDKGKGKAKV
ncbi:hypothetical protein Tco_0800223 [Tanacetum coccineum]|uniref:Uncharacterized protein n=1 Tax=Tanacetum coccineum TaxID=301880 RepID=A0ABQ4ZSI5_9ASTR